MTPAEAVVALKPRAAARIIARITVLENGCWQWFSHKDNGYGTITLWYKNKRKVYLMHRLLYFLAIGPLPRTLVLDHLCRNRQCCNPTHVEPVTLRENIERGVWKPRGPDRRPRKKDGYFKKAASQNDATQPFGNAP